MLLAAYQARDNRSETLAEYLDNRVFAGTTGSSMAPDAGDSAGFTEYMKQYRAALAVEEAAVKSV